jgi:hypothetical protein
VAVVELLPLVRMHLMETQVVLVVLVFHRALLARQFLGLEAVVVTHSLERQLEVLVELGVAVPLGLLQLEHLELLTQAVAVALEYQVQVAVQELLF